MTSLRESELYELGRSDAAAGRAMRGDDGRFDATRRNADVPPSYYVKGYETTISELETKAKRLTKPRRHGLLVLAGLDHPGFRSNATVQELGYVYWQTVDWLIAERLAEFVPGTANYQVMLTDAGRALARVAS